MSKSFCLFSGFFIVFLAALHLANAAPNDPVNIPDAGLRAAIETKLGKTSGATITESEMNGMAHQLSANRRNISDLTGLEHATGITSLQLVINNISDLSPLSGLTQLTSLNLDRNPMTDLSDLANLINLTTLSAERPATLANYNAPTPADLSFLTNLTALTYLRLGFWTIRDISVLANLTALEQLFIDYNHIADVSPLGSLTALSRLHIRFNRQLMDISPLGSVTTLEELILSENDKLSDISALGSLTNLHTLWLHHTNITSEGLSELFPSLSSLSSLILDGTRISDLSVLDRLPDTPPMWSVKVRHMHDPPGSDDSKGWLLKDLTPLVALMQKGKLRPGEAEIEVLYNWNLDYDSLYTDIPALAAGVAKITYSPVAPGLRRRSEEHHVGRPRSTHTFRVSAYNTSTDQRAAFYNPPRYTAEKVNEAFEGVPITWKVTAPDGTETETQALTDADGLASVTITLGNHGEKHTVVAVVPENIRPAAEGPSHPELSVSFTATADRNAPGPPRPPRTGGGGIRGPNRTPDSLAFRGQIGFSELMFDTGSEPEALPQWIELCNVSQTETVNLWDWILEIEAYDAGGEHRHAVVRLDNLQILPNNVALIVTADAPNSVNLLKGSVYNFFEHHPHAFRDNKSQQKIPEQNRVLGQTGFYLRLSHPTDGVSDVVGNLDGNKLTSDEPVWELPSMTIDTGARTSLLRHYQHGKQMFPDGKTSSNWRRAADVRLEVMTYYGKETDIGNPGRKAGWRFPPGNISFSELMLASKGGLHSLPQWIELYNDSETEVDLRDYQLKIETLDASGQRRHAVIKLESFLIPPRQTAVLVSEIGRSSRSIRPYVQHLAQQGKHHRDRNKVFGQTGFFLKLSDPDGRINDIAGNLDGIQRTADAPRWELPAGMTPDGARTSLIRRYYRVAGIPLDGKSEESWIPASEMPLEVMTYYGRSTDIGNPGYVNDARRIRGSAVSFSELMFTESRGRRSLPAWIEIYNGSESAVDLRDYQLKIEARDAVGEHRHDVITFQRFSIPAHQTAVLVTSHGRQSPDLPQDRIYVLYRRMPPAFRQVPNQILGESGFFLKLSDPEGQVSDVVGNLDGDKRTKDPPVWELPAGKTEAGARTSLMRRYHEIGMPFDGRVSENWRTASEMRLEVSSYYGKETDISNPGYTNQQRGIPGHQVSFSELMLTSRGGLHSLPQWIELYNDSETEVDLRGWQLHIEARDAAGEHRHGIITLKDLRIPANQTALIVTWQGRSSREIPREVVYNISDQKAFDRNAVLGQSGFFLKLLDPEGQVRDIAGNLDGDRRTQDTPAWQLPTGKTEEGHRISLMRRYYHITGIPLNGSISENWVPASKLPLKVESYYGKETDIGNPGHRGGGPLPVGLSRFHPVRDKATGHVKITWVTESELNNAGFNILRSETKSGEFKVINVKGLIAGHGTTNEKHVYTFTDTTAKPNVVYYYRLEDVSLAGQQTPLATTHVRGNVVAAGKLMTMWGDLKKSR